MQALRIVPVVSPVPDLYTELTPDSFPRTFYCSSSVLLLRRIIKFSVPSVLTTGKLTSTSSFSRSFDLTGSSRLGGANLHMADMPETNDAAAAPISTVTKPLAESIQINGAPKENGTQPELSNAEKKKLAKAEKAAKRAAEKEAAGLPVAHQTLSQQESVLQTTLDIPQGHSSGKRRPSMHSRTGEPKVEETKPPQTTGAPVVPQPDKQLPIRVRRASDTTHDTKEVGWVSHLYGQSKRQTLEGSNKEVHPAIQVLGAQLSSYEICGSHARCVAMLLAMKSVRSCYCFQERDLC